MATFTTNAFNWWLDGLLLSGSDRRIGYLSLHTGNPGTDGLANEITGTGYARKTITLNSSTGANTNLISWTNSGETSWDTITHVGLWFGSTNSYHLGNIALAIGKEVPAGETLAIGIGDLVASVPSGLTTEGRSQLLNEMSTGNGTILGRIRLHTGDPGTTGDANLISGATGYAAVAVTFGAASGGVSANTTEPLFVNNGTVAWPTVTHWSLGSGPASVGYAKGALATPLTLAAGDMATFPAGSLTITLTNN